MKVAVRGDLPIDQWVHVNEHRWGTTVHRFLTVDDTACLRPIHISMTTQWRHVPLIPVVVLCKGCFGG